MNVHVKTGISEARGTILTAASFALWGVLPGYWKLLAGINPLQIVGHRTLWTCVFAFMLLAFTGRIRKVRNALLSRGTRIGILAGSIMIFTNWLVYIYAVNSGNIVQASLGYYINPLVSILLGMTVLRERLSPVQLAALILAAAGVLYITLQQGNFPWISVVLAFSFAFYGLVKKSTGVDSMPSLAVESLFLAPLAIPAAAGVVTGAFLPFGQSWVSCVLLVFSGIVTGLPLYLFAEGAKSIPLSRVGFLQYISPTLSLFIGVAVYGEKFTADHAVSFGLIWTALVLYSLSGIIGRGR